MGETPDTPASELFGSSTGRILKRSLAALKRDKSKSERRYVTTGQVVTLLMAISS